MDKCEVAWKINIFNKSWDVVRVIRQGAGKDSVQQNIGKQHETNGSKW